MSLCFSINGKAPLEPGDNVFVCVQLYCGNYLMYLIQGTWRLLWVGTLPYQATRQLANLKLFSANSLVFLEFHLLLSAGQLPRSLQRKEVASPRAATNLTTTSRP